MVDRNERLPACSMWHHQPLTGCRSVASRQEVFVIDHVQGHFWLRRHFRTETSSKPTTVTASYPHQQLRKPCGSSRESNICVYSDTTTANGWDDVSTSMVHPHLTSAAGTRLHHCTFLMLIVNMDGCIMHLY